MLVQIKCRSKGGRSLLVSKFIPSKAALCIGASLRLSNRQCLFPNVEPSLLSALETGQPHCINTNANNRSPSHIYKRKHKLMLRHNLRLHWCMGYYRSGWHLPQPSFFGPKIHSSPCSAILYWPAWGLDVQGWLHWGLSEVHVVEASWKHEDWNKWLIGWLVCVEQLDGVLLHLENADWEQKWVANFWGRCQLEQLLTLNDENEFKICNIWIPPFKKFVGTNPLLPSFFFTLVQPSLSSSTSFTTSSLSRSTNPSSFDWKAWRALRRLRFGFASMILAGCHKLHYRFRGAQ